MKKPEEIVRLLLRETLLPVFVALAVIVPLRSAVADWNDVPSGSMRPTILEGDRIWVNKLAFGLRIPLTMTWAARWDGPERGDIVTLSSPRDGTRLVKRIVGLPGDRIEMKANRLRINGEFVRYDEGPRGRNDGTGSVLRPSGPGDASTSRVVAEHLGPRRHAITLTPALAGRIDSFRALTVPEGHYFFMGDNRDRSGDSRILGTVPLDQIHGRVSHVALSVDRADRWRPRFERWGLRLE